MRILPLLLAGVTTAGLASPLSSEAHEAEAPAPTPACVRPGGWVGPADRAVLDPAVLIETAARRPVVLLGESHTNAEHHRWQLQMVAALYARRPAMVLGFEAFPRGVQSVLDRWVRGEMDVKTFLDQTRWETVWGFPAEMYLPLFHFARMNRIPMVALNVERELVGRVRESGWDAVPADQREGVGEPAPPSPAYRDHLARILDQHRDPMTGDGADEKDGEPHESPAASIAAAATDAAADALDRDHFIAAQTTWDRAMAEALATARARHGAALVVGILGNGHVEHGWGVPHQLAALGIADPAVLVPWDVRRPCDELVPGLADAVFGTAPPPDDEAAAPPRPKLGIMIEDSTGQVTVKDVVAGSIADATGLHPGDAVAEAAGQPVTDNAGLVAIIRRQAPGTWLPLKIRRNGETLDMVAKFPAETAE